MAGTNHITYGEPALIRLTTDAPLSYIEDETAFALTRPLHLVLGADEPFAGEPAATVREFLAAHPRLLARMGAAAVHRL